MLALLRTRRWAGFTVLTIALILAFGVLSRWQWSRAEERQAERVELEAAEASAPMALTPGVTPLAWNPVVVEGTYEAAAQVAVRKRPLSAVNGFWIMTPLRTSDGQRVWVNRGWQAASGAATDSPVLPTPPAGVVQVEGWWRALEEGGPTPADLPAGMVTAASAAELLPPGDWPGFVQRATSQPADPLIVLPRPAVDESRNISYAIQWALFAAIAIVGWWIFLRREAREDAEAQHPNQAEVA